MAKRSKVCRNSSPCGLSCISEKKVCRKNLASKSSAPLESRAGELSTTNQFHRDRFERWKLEKTLEERVARIDGRLSLDPDSPELLALQEENLRELEEKFPRNPVLLEKRGLPGPGERYTPDLTDKALKDYPFDPSRDIQQQQREVYEKQGFNGKPSVVEDLAAVEEELWVAPNGSPAKFFRGVPEIEYQEDFKYGDTHFIGKGLYGNGTYVVGAGRPYGEEEEAKQLGMKFAKGRGEVQVMGLKKDAVVFPGGYEDLYAFLQQKYGNKIDLGLGAALEGIDAYEAMVGENQGLRFDYYVVLNRGKVVVQEAYEQ